MPNPSQKQPYILHRLRQGCWLSSLLNTAVQHSRRAHGGLLGWNGGSEPVAMSTIEALLRKGQIIETARSTDDETTWHIFYGLVETLDQAALEETILEAARKNDDGLRGLLTRASETMAEEYFDLLCNKVHQIQSENLRDIHDWNDDLHDARTVAN